MPHGLICVPRLFAKTGRSCTACDALPDCQLMLTQCPNCQTTFRVTTEILRVADGQVRCGRCQTQFDALERLIDENEAAEVQSGRAARDRGTAALARGMPRDIEVEEPAAQEDITLEGRHIEISGRYRLPDSPRG